MGKFHHCWSSYTIIGHSWLHGVMAEDILRRRLWTLMNSSSHFVLLVHWDILIAGGGDAQLDIGWWHSKVTNASPLMVLKRGSATATTCVCQIGRPAA